MQVKIPNYVPPPNTITTSPSKKRWLNHTVILAIASFFILISGMSFYILYASDEKKLVSVKMPYVQPTATAAPSVLPTSSPTPDPYAEWKIFSNKSYSIKYPPRFTIVEKKPQFTTSYPKIHSITTFSDAVSTITIAVAKPSKKMPIDDVIGNGPLLTYGKDVTAGKPIKPLQIGKNMGLVVHNITAGQTGTAADIVFLSDGKVYEITLSPTNTDVTTLYMMLSTITPLNDEPSDSTDSWNIRVDPAYHFSFKYPLSYTIDFNKVASGSPNLTTVYDNGGIIVDAPKFRIDVQDPKNFGESAITSRELLKLSLAKFVDKKWEYNKAATDSAILNRVVSSIKELTVDGQQAFEFSVTGKYVDDHVSERLNEEYRFIFTEKNGYKYKIWFPKGNSSFDQIVKTLTFTK